jgi:hypothetical protein
MQPVMNPQRRNQSKKLPRRKSSSYGTEERAGLARRLLNQAEQSVLSFAFISLVLIVASILAGVGIIEAKRVISEQSIWLTAGRTFSKLKTAALNYCLIILTNCKLYCKSVTTALLRYNSNL